MVAMKHLFETKGQKLTTSWNDHQTS